MGTGGNKKTTLDSKKESTSQKVALVDILTKADFYNSKVVTITGMFKGWKGKCPSSFSITRSDWILADGDECVYVSGTLPPGASAVRPEDERLEVTAKVKVAADGKVNLKAAAINVRK
jgi:hypothetical protein